MTNAGRDGDVVTLTRDLYIVQVLYEWHPHSLKHHTAVHGISCP